MQNLNDITIILLYASTQVIAIGMVLLGWVGERRRQSRCDRAASLPSS